MLQLPKNFESYDLVRQAGFLRAKAVKEKGIPMVGVFCTYTPKELIMAAGAVSVGLCGMSEEPIAAAETKLPKNLCPLIKSSYGFAVSETCPYFYFSDLVVGETTCDGKKKMYELLGQLKDVYVIHLPHSPKRSKAVEYFYQELLDFKKMLEDKFQVEITDEKLRKAIHEANEERAAMLRLYGLGKMNPAVISGYELSSIANGLDFQFFHEERMAVMNQAYQDGLNRREASKANPQGARRPRLIITGCPIGGVREKIIKAVEDLGADVVSFEICSGPREKQTAVDENPEKDPLWAMAEKYLQIGCSIMTPNDSRLVTLENMVREYQADAVLEVVLQACHTYNVESYTIKRFVTDSLKKPYYMLETDYSKADSGQIQTRLEAFLETIPC